MKTLTDKGQRKLNVLFLVQLAVFTTIEGIFCFSPLGSIKMPGIVATLAHLPALVAAISLGYAGGAVIGGVMGLSALYIWTFMPPPGAAPVAFVFTPFVQGGNIFSLLICVVPRVLFPLVAVFAYRRLRSWKINVPFSGTIAGVVATFAHSLMVLGTIYLAFNGSKFVGKDFIPFIVAWGGVNALMEMAVAAVVMGALTYPLVRLNAARLQKS